jgi:dipeptidase E
VVWRFACWARSKHSLAWFAATPSLAALGELGFDAAERDLRGYSVDEERLCGDLAGAALAWLRGGNVFMLRYALRRSGGDTVLCSLLAGDALV